MTALGDLQFSFLPFGSLLLLAVVGVLFLRRRQFKRGEVATILLSGVSAGLLVVGTLYFLGRLPWSMACLDCFAADPWYSITLTLAQGWGFVSAAAMGWVLLRHSRHQGDEGGDAA